MRLVERVGAGSPPPEHQAEADRLEDTGKSTDSNCVQRTPLSEDLGDELDESQQISSSFAMTENDIRWAQS